MEIKEQILGILISFSCTATCLLSCPFQPVIGCDPHLRMNLETFFQLDYPKVSELGVVS